MRKPAKVAFSIVEKQVEAKAISDAVSDVLVKNTSPVFTEYLNCSSVLLLTSPLTVAGNDLLL